jgi:leader peptidase (prepilin peptidase) / N-methyltransferase
MTPETRTAAPSTDRVLLILPLALAGALVPIALLPDRDAERLATQLFVVVLVALAAIDFATLRVPNLVVYPSIAFALAATGLIHSHLLPAAAVGGLGLLGLMFLIAIVGRGAMGMGDVKLAAFIGCVLGIRAGFIALLFGFAIGGATALMVLLLRLRQRKDSLPLTPFLAAGAIIDIVLFGSLLTRGQV